MNKGFARQMVPMPTTNRPSNGRRARNVWLLLSASSLIVATLVPAARADAASCTGSVRAARVAVGLPTRFDTIAWRESRCNPAAINRRTHDYGAWQLHAPTTIVWCARRIGPGSALSLGWNARCAAALYRTFGYRPWY